MTVLSSLKLVFAQRSTAMSAVQYRRHKLSQKLQEQIALAQAQQAGKVYAPLKTTAITDDAGEEGGMPKAKRVTPWWWPSANGQLNLAVRYGAKSIELAKGKNAIEIAHHAELVPTLELIHQAVMLGELYAAIEAVTSKARTIKKAKAP